VGRKATGTVEWAEDHWRARITLPGGKRRWVRLPPTIVTEEQAKAKAASLSQLARDRGGVVAADVAAPAPTGETVQQWWERWAKRRADSGMTSARPTASYARTHILPRLGPLKMAEVQREHLEDLVAALDELVEQEELSGKSARNIWGVATKMFRDACASKRREFRARGDNPAVGVAPPEPGDEKELQFLYPDELVALAACPEVPHRFAQLCALATGLFPRPGELEVLDCDSIDLAHDTIHWHRAKDDVTGETKEIKTGAARRVPIEPSVRPLVELLHREAGGRGLLVPWMHAERELTPLLRAALKLAGVARGELFARDATRNPIRFYDLRASGITWMACRGDAPQRMMQRAGHKTFSTTLRYVRTAEALGSNFGTPFPPLPARLLIPSVNRPSAATPETQKPRQGRGFRMVAGVGFEPPQAPRDGSHDATPLDNPAPPSPPDATRHDPADDIRTLSGTAHHTWAEALDALAGYPPGTPERALAARLIEYHLGGAAGALDGN